MDDLPDLLAIESASFAQPWTKVSFLSELSKVPPSLYVVRRETSSCILGYICFWLVADEIQMLNLAVHPDYRQQGLGRQLMTLLFAKAEEKKCIKSAVRGPTLQPGCHCPISLPWVQNPVSSSGLL